MWQASAKGLVMFTDQTSISLNWQNIVFALKYSMTCLSRLSHEVETGWKDRWMDGLITDGDLTHNVFSNDFKVKDRFSKVGLKPLKSWCNFWEVCGGHKTRSWLFYWSPSLVLVLRSNQTCLTLLQSIVLSLVWQIVFTCERLSHISLLKGFLKSCQALLVYGSH